MLDTVEGFFGDHEFGDAEHKHGLRFQHFDIGSKCILFCVETQSDVAAVKGAVDAAMAALIAAHPECKDVTFTIDPDD